MIDFSARNITGIYAKHFKCFDDRQGGFEDFKPFNVIIGRNNSGKSSMIDMLEYFANSELIAAAPSRNGLTPEFTVQKILKSSDFQECITSRTLVITRGNYTQEVSYPKDWASKNMTDTAIECQIQKGKELKFVRYLTEFENDSFAQAVRDQLQSQILQAVPNPIQGMHFSRILSDRDVTPENKGEIGIQSNGVGFTATVQFITHKDGYERDLVEVHLLTELNKIFGSDAKFTRILIEEIADGKWEVFLEEEKKGRVRLSQMGSGVKTVLLVLAFLELLPNFQKGAENRENTIYAFEELENNLHPAIQRRLFNYLRQKAVEYNTTFVVTTHSNVVIDLFYDDEQAQVLHVQHDGATSTVQRVDSHANGCSVLEDLDVRASDMLQSNCIVWVEGPSDRMYFNKWIKLWTDGELVEGVHYQCLAYGGSCNANVSFEEPDEVAERMAAFRINRNAILLADSDKREEDDNLKIHTERLRGEITDNGGYSWITYGKEVENYLPPQAIRAFLDDESIKGPGKFSDVFAYMKSKKGNSAKYKKTALAKKILPHINSKEMLRQHQDLKSQLDEVVSLIRSWNRVESRRVFERTKLRELLKARKPLSMGEK